MSEPKFKLRHQDENVFWFKMLYSVERSIAEEISAFALAAAWVRENIPSAYVLPPEGLDVLITHPVYASAFRLRWC